MPSIEKILYSIMIGTQDSNIRFADLQKLLEALGFSYRVRGDHYIFTKANVSEIINLQPDGNKAKPYQVKQVRAIILKYKLEV